MLDAKTGELFPQDSPEMVQIMKVWNALPFAHREAFINVTCFNSRDPRDLLVLQEISTKMEAALKLADRNVS